MDEPWLRLHDCWEPGTTFCGGEFTGSMEATDSRLDGHVAVTASGASGAVRIEIERGAWSGALGVGGDVPMVGSSRFGAWLVREDAHEGLNAVMYATLVGSEGDHISQQWTVDGWVFADVPWPEAVPDE
jgi:hypothetical protein